MTNKTVYVKNIDSFIEKVAKSGYSYRKLAKGVKTIPTTITLIAKGERNPSPEVAVNICKALRCQFNDIFFI